MRILHLTDFHFTKQTNFDHSKLLQKMEDVLKTQKPFDCVFFTGDLLDKGGNIDDFKNAYRILKGVIADTLGLTDDKFFICAGNHDVNRGKEMKGTTKLLGEFTTNEEIDGFVKDDSVKNRDFHDSLYNIKEYVELQQEIYEKGVEDYGDIIKPLYTIHKREVDGKKIGISTINTAWRSNDSKKDRGQLLFPVTHVKRICEELKNQDFSIMLLHHPLSDLKSFNQREIEDAIHENFHVMLSGHIHKKQHALFIRDEEGILCCASPATISMAERGAERGFTTLEIDMNLLNVKLENFTYVEADSKFILSTDCQFDIPVNSVKREQNDFRRTLQKKLAREIEQLDELFIATNSNGHKQGFLKMFTTPILKSKSKAEIAGNKQDVDKTSLTEVAFDSKDYIIFGKDKSGKTSLLNKIKIDLLSEFYIRKWIPFYLDFNDFKGQSQNDLDLLTKISRYYELSRSGAEKLIKEHHLRLLIDNFDNKQQQVISGIKEFAEAFAGNVSFVICAEETMLRNLEFLNTTHDENKYTVLYIHEITRKEIRELTNKWPNLSDDQKESILPRIKQIFTQLNIPANYWTVSLFLWIYEKNSDVNVHNNIELVEFYVDGMLDRSGIVLDRNARITYEDFKIYIAALAHELVTLHQSTSYSISYAELVSFTDKYRNDKIRFVISVEEVIKLMTDKGILKKKVDDSYTFRLNGVFEYFIAYHMKNDSEFRDKVINDDSYYLSYGNELELYSGFNKLDEEFVNSILKKTKSIYKSINEKYSQEGGADTILLKKAELIFDITKPLSKITSGRNTPIPPEVQDELMEEMTPLTVQSEDVREKKYYSQLAPTPQNLEKSLFILSRVFRNTSVSDEQFNNDVLDFLLESACNFGFVIIDSPNEVFGGKKVEGDAAKELVKLTMTFMPLIVQTFLFDALAQNNLERIFRNKIAELKQDPQNNQFKLLILYTMLVDLDLQGNQELIDEILEVISMTVLRQTFLIKLYTYFMFKTHNRTYLEQFLTKRIEQLQLKINRKTDKDKLRKELDRKKKIKYLPDSM